ncbi:hypothetical protein Tco_0304248 [Tanacetum coccineum]
MDKICKPKAKGGLGIKNLSLWNKAMLVKHLWNLACKKDTLWVKWIHAVKIKGTSIWNVQGCNTDSWGWKNFLSIRDQNFHHAVYKIGNGINVSMWNDNWAKVGVLSNYITHISLYTERLSNSLNVADMVGDNCWKWPNEWLIKYPEIVSIPVPTLNSNDDKVV